MKTILYIFLVVLIFSCKKKDIDSDTGPSCNPLHFDLMSQDLLNTRFKTGTYWVYLDSVTLTHDSEYVTSHTQSVYSLPGYCDIYEYFQYNTNVFPSGKTNAYVINHDGIYKSPDDFMGGVNIYTDYTTAKNNNNPTTYDSLFIYDRYYKNVEKVTVNRDHTFSNDSTTYYMNSACGILKIEIASPSLAILTSKKLLIRKNIMK